MQRGSVSRLTYRGFDLPQTFAPFLLVPFFPLIDGLGQSTLPILFSEITAIKRKML
jgi:hypothetical protein